MLDSDFDRKRETISTDPERRRAYYYAPPDQPPPPMALALALHRCILVDGKALSADDFGAGLSDIIRTMVSPPAGMTVDQFLAAEALDRTRLRGWVQISRAVTLPPPDHRGLVLTALRQFALKYGIDAAAIAAFDEPWRQSPSRLLARFGAGSDAEKAGGAFDPIDPLFHSAQQLVADDHQEYVIDLADHLLGGRGRDQIIVLQGDQYQGKRRIVSNLISSRASDGFLRLGDGTRLPLFARASCSPFDELVRDVALFLDIPVADEPHIIAQIDDILSQIERKARITPSVYVLCSVPAPKHATDLLRMEALGRLIKALHVPGSRMLLTATDRIPGEHHLTIYRRKLANDFPTLADIPKRFKSLADIAINAAEPLSGFIKPERQIAGPLVVLLDTVSHLIEDEQADGRIEFDVERIVRAVRKVLVKCDEGAFCDAEQMKIQDHLTGLARVIYDFFKDDRQRWILRCLAMSEDGCRTSSLALLLRNARDVKLIQLGFFVKEESGAVRAHMPEEDELKFLASKLVERLPRLCFESIVTAGPMETARTARHDGVPIRLPHAISGYLRLTFLEEFRPANRIPE